MPAGRHLLGPHRAASTADSEAKTSISWATTTRTSSARVAPTTRTPSLKPRRPSQRRPQRIRRRRKLRRRRTTRTMTTRAAASTQTQTVTILTSRGRRPSVKRGSRKWQRRRKKKGSRRRRQMRRMRRVNPWHHHRHRAEASAWLRRHRGPSRPLISLLLSPRLHSSPLNQLPRSKRRMASSTSSADPHRLSNSSRRCSSRTRDSAS